MLSSNNYGAQGTNESSDIQRQINKTTDESLESTRRMLGLVVVTQEVGVNTVKMLDEQGEKLDQIEIGLDNIHVGMNEAERNLDNLQKCCGLCVLPWNRVRRKNRPFTNSSTTNSTEKSSPITAEPKLRMSGDEGMPTTGYITPITKDDRETEMDDNLQLVASYVGNLKNIALDMGDTITSQSKQIDRIAEKNDAGLQRVTAANKQTQDLIRRA